MAIAWCLKNDTPIEGEALAIAWCLQKARNYLLGVKHLMLLTDHKPLINIFSSKALSSISNPRLLRIKQKTLSYNFTIKHIAGKNNTFTDTLSRYPVNIEEDEDIGFAAETKISCILVATACVEDMGVNNPQFKETAMEDYEYQSKVHKRNFAKIKKEEEHIIKPFCHLKDRLSIVDGILMYSFDGGNLRAVIPKKLRPNILSVFHSAHQGVDTISRRRHHIKA